MTKILIIESCEKKINPNYSNTSIVHVRNSLIIADILGADLITHEDDIQQFSHQEYDVIICMYASPYMKWKKYFKLLQKNNLAKLFWLVNDHDLEDNILLRQAIINQGRGFDMVCNNTREGYRHWILGKRVLDKKLNDFIDNWDTINLNVLIFDSMKRHFSSKPELFSKSKSELIYYGTFRKHRMSDLLKYNGCNYTLSTSVKNQKKYVAAGVKARFIDRLKWTKHEEGLFNFKYSLYVEDLHTHSNYAYMANRYYECLMCEVLMFFDSSCRNTIDLSGYIIPDYLIVDNGTELAEKIKKLESHKDLYFSLLKTQLSNFSRIEQEKTDVVKKLKRIFN